MNSVIFSILCGFALISLSDANCKSSQSNAAALSIQQHQNYPVDNTYCINLAIRVQSDNDKYAEYYVQDYEALAKAYLLHLNSTVQNKISIDCGNRPNVETGDKSVAYSYNCCKDDSNSNNVICDNPKFVDTNAAFQHVISFTSLIFSVLVYYVSL